MMENIGHKKRLRERFMMSGLTGFHDYEVLELLLSYVIVRRDCKNMAKELLKKYGDLYTIFSQSNEELQKNKYITERVVIYLKTIFNIIEDELYKKIYKSKIKITNNNQLINYLNMSLVKRDIEVFKVLFLNTQNELIAEEDLFKGTLDRSTVYIRELVKKIIKYNAKSIIIVHNHPGGSLKPSGADIELTVRIQEALENIEMRVLDHIIISEKGYFSFLEGGIL